MIRRDSEATDEDAAVFRSARKILVIGCPGAGKSTFARKLRDVTGLPLHYLDQIWHKPDRTTVSRETFDARLSEILATDRWIIDGNFQRTMEWRLAQCDTVFLFDLPVADCIAGAQARIGTQREDLPWMETELDAEFRQYIIDFPTTRLPNIYALLDACCERKRVVVFTARAAADNYLRRLETAAQNAAPL